MVDEVQLREILHEMVGEMVNHLFLRGVHDQYRVSDMVKRLHKKIDTLESE